MIQGGGTANLVGGTYTFSGTGAGLQVKGAGTTLDMGNINTVTGAGKLVTDAGTTFAYSSTVPSNFNTTGAITLDGQFNWNSASNFHFLAGSGAFNVNGGMAITGRGSRS